MTMAAADNPYAAFWMGGFEGADHCNGNGVALDMADLSGHVAQLEADHARAAALGIGAVRESIGWRLAEPAPGRFDLARARRIAASAERHGLQVIWTLMHYGTPADVDLTDDAAIERFAAFASAVAATLGPLSDRPPIYNLVNEISFLAWAVSHTAMIHPYRPVAEPDPATARAAVSPTAASGYQVKRRLVRMALAGVAAVRAIDPRARFLHVEPLVHVVAPVGEPALAGLAEQISAYQWQAWDLLCGRAEPALGGSPAALDLLGINHYHSSQWEAASEERLWWHLRDARRRPFRQLLAAAWERYHRPLLVAETSHFGEGRSPWLNELAAEVAEARAARIPVHGICLYPLVDRPDWDDLSRWHHSGLWDVVPEAAAGEPPLRRVLCGDYAAALRRWQPRLPEPAEVPAVKPLLVVFSHLRWGFVHHRPQQLMSRLAADFRILFIEEPLPHGLGSEVPARLDRISQGPDIDVLLLRSPLVEPGFTEAQVALLGPLLAEHLRSWAGAGCTAWFYTPMALPLLAAVPARRVVYDCIDELGAFLGAPADLPAQELALLGRADLVLASGPALQEAKRPGSRSAVRRVDNGVAAADFAPAGLDTGSAHAGEARRLLGRHPGPRLGYSGVVDERLDLALIESLARARPGWQLVIAGPVVKIDRAALPRLPNILWLDFQPYVRLPHLIAPWDVCLLPFVETPLTRLSNPVKVLEYLAAEKPVVATPLPDVVALHAGAVAAARGAADFIAACDRALAEGAESRAIRLACSRRRVAEASWERRAGEVRQWLEGATERPAGI